MPEIYTWYSDNKCQKVETLLWENTLQAKLTTTFVIFRCCITLLMHYKLLDSSKTESDLKKVMSHGNPTSCPICYTSDEAFCE